jgi:protein-S-isoprenylcysteine O-methyltransferase Ste14
MTDTDPDLSNAAARANTLPWPPMLFAVAILASWWAGRAAPLTWPGTDDMAARVLGLAFGAGGLVLAGWSIATLMRGGTTVMPHGQSAALVTNGPYARLRNPIYLGEVMILFGLAELSKNIWFVVAALVFAILVTALQIIPEERHLTARFGDAYRDYQARTRRWI